MHDESAPSVPIDREHLAEISMGDEQFEREIIAEWLSAAPGILATMCAGAEQGDVQRIAFAAHALKGSCRSLGIGEVAALSGELETRARRGDLPGARELLAGIRTAVERAEAWLRREWGI